MTVTFQQIHQQIARSLNSLSQANQTSIRTIKQLFNGFNPRGQQQITKLNTCLEKDIKQVLTEIMSKGDLKKVASLIELICDLSGQQKVNDSNQKRIFIKQTLAIIIVQQVLECLGINDLKQILPTISQKICSFKNLQINDQNRLLRVINHLLRRISKTQDYLIRGQLQFTLTKILPICHDSGFHYRVPNAKGIQIIADEQNQEYKAVFNSEGITYQFYKEFWELQKYLVDPNELSNEDISKGFQEQNPKKGALSFKSDPLITLRLKHIQKVLNDLISYLNKHPCSQSPTTLLNQPIKFLTNTHLLQYQLNDQYFRKIIMIQVLIFTFTLKHLKPTGNILKGVMLTEPQRQVINRIELLSQKYFENIQKQQFLKPNSQGEQNQCLSMIEVMKTFFTNELEWLELKDHWKEKKKSFLKIEPSIIQTQQNAKTNKQNVDYKKKIIQVQQKIANQMNIQGDTLLKFLTQPCIPHIVTTPTQTSFAYYWSQGKSCLDTFDYENLVQHDFQTKSQYNMFEWRALRSLYKETLKQISLGQKNIKLREYKALAFIEKKQKQFTDRQNQTKIEKNNNQERKDNTSENSDGLTSQIQQNNQNQVKPSTFQTDNNENLGQQPTKKQKIQ